MMFRQMKTALLLMPSRGGRASSLDELGEPWAVLSAHDRHAVAKLEAALIQAVRRAEDELTAFVPYAEASILGLIYGKCRVTATTRRTKD